jgi:tRNA-dihydrouridine synthase
MQGRITTSWQQKYENQSGPRKRDTRWTPYSEGGYVNRNNKAPLIVQIAGHDPLVMSEAARLILERTNTLSDEVMYSGAVGGIDVNCGCPQAIARSGRYGAFLMEDSPNTVYTILSRLKKDLPKNIGVSAKIRIPEGASKTTEGKQLLKDRIIRMIDSGYVFYIVSI